MYRGRRLDRLGSQTLGSVGLPGNGDPCLLALLWNRNVLLPYPDCQFSGGCSLVLEHGHQPGTSVDDYASPD